MKINILGSNGWYSTATGQTVCLLIESKDYYIILDAGDGLSKLDEYINSAKPIFLFLSHFHLDHISGLHTLAKFQFHQPIEIFGQSGTKDILNKTIDHPYSMPLSDLKIKVIIKDLPAGINNPPQTPFPVESRYLVHADPCFGYRFNIDGRIISYCTDTGICDNLLALAQNADILIAECVHKPGQQNFSGWPHLRPEDSASIAKKAKVKRLLLTHFDANLYRTKEERIEAEKAAQKIFPKTTACFDGLKIEI